MNVNINAFSRVLFGVEGTYFASIDSGGITADTIECVNECSLGTSNGGQTSRMPTILANIEDKSRLPINPGTASPHNIQDKAVTLDKVSTSSSPLLTYRGGTGVSSVGPGRILVGSGVSTEGKALAMSTSAIAKVVDSSNTILEITGDLRIGENAIGIRYDIYGRPTLACTPQSSLIARNLIAPGLQKPSCTLAVSISSAIMTITVTKTGGYPVHAFVVVTRSTTPLKKSGITNPSRVSDKDYASSRVPFRGDSVTMQYTPSQLGTYKVYAVMGDARGTLSDISVQSISYGG